MLAPSAPSGRAAALPGAAARWRRPRRQEKRTDPRDNTPGGRGCDGIGERCRCAEVLPDGSRSPPRRGSKLGNGTAQPRRRDQSLHVYQRSRRRRAHSSALVRQSLAARPLEPYRRAGSLAVGPGSLAVGRTACDPREPRLFFLAQGFPFATDRFPVAAQSHRHLAGCPAASTQRQFSRNLGLMGRSRGLGIASRTFGRRKRSLSPRRASLPPDAQA